VYIDHQWRHDLYVPEESNNVELMAIDPGVRVKIQCARVPLRICNNVELLAAHCAENAATVFSSIDDSAWKRIPGRGAGEDRETSERKADPVYNEWSG
jgi:hypothetical protein